MPGHCEPNRHWHEVTCSSWHCSTSSFRQGSTAFHCTANWRRQRQGSRHLSRWSPTSVSRFPVPVTCAPWSPVTLFSVHEILIGNKYAFFPKCLWWVEHWHEDMNRCYSCRNPFCASPPSPSVHPVPWISFLCWARSPFPSLHLFFFTPRLFFHPFESFHIRSSQVNFIYIAQNHKFASKDFTICTAYDPQYVDVWQLSIQKSWHSK